MLVLDQFYVTFNSLFVDKVIREKVFLSVFFLLLTIVSGW